MKQALILGSSSPARRKLLERLLLPFTWVSPDIDETQHADETPAEMVVRLAEAKARKIAETHPTALIIGSDQVGVVNNMILGKPHTQANAIAQLQQVSGHYCEFLNGLCVYNAETDHAQVRLIKTVVHYRPLTLAMIETYLAKEDVLHCAGGIKSEGLAVALFDRFEGDDPSALEGLPLIALTRMLEEEGVVVV
jgi:MAF protein